MNYNIIRVCDNEVIYSTDNEDYAKNRLSLLCTGGNFYIRCNDISRRNRVDKMSPVELTIRDAVKQIEELGCSIGLTEAINHLHKARELVADFIDKK